MIAPLRLFRLSRARFRRLFRPAPLLVSLGWAAYALAWEEAGEPGRLAWLGGAVIAVGLMWAGRELGGKG